MNYMPLKEEYTTLKKQGSDLKLKLLENKAVAEDLPRFQEEVDILNAELNNALSLLPNEANVHDLYRKLAITAKKTNVELLNFKPGGTANEGFYTSISMELKIEGTFHDIATFIDQAGKQERIINVSNLSFSKGAKVGPNAVPMLSVDCKATSFMFSGGQS